ncbi:MAG: hypothetical protein ACXWHC_15070 [Usitatibacter sp.]
MADLNGVAFLRSLRSAEAFRDRAILSGSRNVKTPASRSRALLVSVTRCDHHSDLADAAPDFEIRAIALRVRV